MPLAISPSYLQYKPPQLYLDMVMSSCYAFGAEVPTSYTLSTMESGQKGLSRKLNDDVSLVFLGNMSTPSSSVDFPECSFLPRSGPDTNQ